MSINNRPLSLPTKRILMYFLTFLFLVVIYMSALTKITYSYYDEVLWISHSYFFTSLVQHDFSDPIWQSKDSYDQPKLAEYIYGAWLYPSFRHYSKQHSLPYDYVNFLIDHGFDQSDIVIPPGHPSYLQPSPYSARLEKGEVGLTSQLIDKYGESIIPTLNIIHTARSLNVFLLALTVLIAASIFARITKHPPLLFMLAYGLNPLMMYFGLLAHADTLFLLLFNLSIYLLLKFFHDKKFTSLLLLSLTTGLCISTKLNGVILIAIYFITYMLHFQFPPKPLPQLLRLFSNTSIYLSVSIFVFILLNPFLYNHTLTHIYEMYQYRSIVVSNQIEFYPSDNLPTLTSRITSIFSEFFYPATSIPHLDIFTLLPSHLLSIVFFLLFLWGIITSLSHKFQPDQGHVILFTFLTTLLITIIYLQLNWPRYVLQLTFFIVYYEILGLQKAWTYLTQLRR